MILITPVTLKLKKILNNKVMFTTFNLIIISLALLGVLGYGFYLFAHLAELESRVHFLERDKYIRDNYDGDIEKWKKATIKSKRKKSSGDA